MLANQSPVFYGYISTDSYSFKSAFVTSRNVADLNNDLISTGSFCGQLTSGTNNLNLLITINQGQGGGPYLNSGASIFQIIRLA